MDCLEIGFQVPTGVADFDIGMAVDEERIECVVPQLPNIHASTQKKKKSMKNHEDSIVEIQHR